MEKGTVRSIDRSGGTGMIGRMSDVDVKFFADSILGKDRFRLKQGDIVWFEVDNVKTVHTAINIRKA